MIAIVDYGVGNICSLYNSFKYIGVEAVLTSDKDTIIKSDKIILPGVGAFADAAKKLQDSGLGEIIVNEAKSSKPLLGICLGMQLLFDKSYEYGETKGLGLIKGDIIPIESVVPKNHKIPHIGWNGLHFPKYKEKNLLFKYTLENECVYFVHSYFGANCHEAVIATTEYGPELTAAVASSNIFGVQFHPEKSGHVGLSILKAFCEL